jgi:hypothetical protein
MNNFASEVYEDTSSLGRFMGLIGLIIAIIVAVILFICAINYKNTPDNPYTTATILSATCTNLIFENKVEYSCILNLKYTVNGREYKNYITTQSNVYYQVNSSIDINYDLNNPNNITIKSFNNSTMSYISCGIGAIIIIGAAINYYLTSKYKFYAAGTGVATTLDLFRR